MAGGAAFILPAVIVILALSVLFVAKSPPLWVLGAGAGAGAAVPAVAVQAAWSLLWPNWERRRSTVRWAAGLATAATVGPWLVLVLLGCGLAELLVSGEMVRGEGRRARRGRAGDADGDGLATLIPNG